MKKIFYFAFMIIVVCLFNTNVNADCTTEEINSLKKEAEKIRVTYKHIEEYEVEEGYLNYNRFLLKFKNVSSDLSVHYYDSVWQKNESNLISFEWGSGKYYFDIFSNKCNILLVKLNVTIPYFNYYSLDPLCDGIDDKNFSLCAKYKNSDYSVSYDTFKTRVKKYRQEHVIDNEVEVEENKIFKSIIVFLDNNKYYFLAGLFLIAIIIAFIALVNKRKRRGVLQ